MRKAMQLKSKIKNLALKNKISAQAVLQNFMLERLLERNTGSFLMTLCRRSIIHHSQYAFVFEILFMK